MSNITYNVAVVVQELNKEVLMGMYQGVHDSLEDRFKAKADEWDKYYLLIGLAGSLIVVVATAGAAAPAVAAAVAAAGSTEATLGLGMLRLAAFSNVLSTGGSALNLYGGYQQNVNKPDAGPTPGAISQMKESLLRSINSAVGRNTEKLAPYEKFADQLVREHSKDRSWIDTFTTETIANHDRRFEEVKKQFFGAKDFDVVNSAQSRANDACSALFDVIAEEAPVYQSTSKTELEKVNAPIFTPRAAPVRGGVSFSYVPPTEAERLERIRSDAFLSRFPDFTSFLRVQANYCVWKRKFGGAFELRTGK